MATQETNFLHRELEVRKQRLQASLALAPQNAGLGTLLQEVDSALDRMADGTYGLCETCHKPIERDRLLADPVLRYCLCDLSDSELHALQHDLELASQVQQNLLPLAGLQAGGYETSYHYAPLGPVSGDYCDLIPSDEQLFFALGDVSGKGVAASMLMTQLHALFRSLTRMSLPLDQIVTQSNRVLCESTLAGHYATLVCGQARPNGEVRIHNAGHLPVIVLHQGSISRIEATGVPLGMFCEVIFSDIQLHLAPGDMLFLFTDGLSESRRSDEEYGVDRIAHLLGRNPGKRPADAIAVCLEDVHTFIDSPPFDDVTVMAIQRMA